MGHIQIDNKNDGTDKSVTMRDGDELLSTFRPNAEDIKAGGRKSSPKAKSPRISIAA